MLENLNMIINAFNETYVGRGFIYKSKYGRTNGVVKSISIQQSFIFDEDTENSLKYFVDHSVKGSKTMEKPEPKKDIQYMAFQPTFHIESTNGVFYDLKECYFLENNLEDKDKMLYLSKKNL